MKICIDPGHGMPDSGAIGLHTREADINLAVAKAVKKHLEHSGVETILTCSGSSRVKVKNHRGDLQARCDIANQADADLFLSIHCNSASGNGHGMEVFCYRRGSESEKLAKILQHSLAAYTQGENRAVKTANFYVLQNTQMPAVLIELLYITTPAEEEKLMNPSWQDGAAEALAKGILQFTAGLVQPADQPHAITPQKAALTEEEWQTLILLLDKCAAILKRGGKNGQ